MRKISGYLVLPARLDAGRAEQVHIELHDVSRVDAPSTILAHRELSAIELAPGRRIPFEFDAPTANGAGLTLRIHVDLDGDGDVKVGDLVTTAHHPVPAEGDYGPVELALTQV